MSVLKATAFPFLIFSLVAVAAVAVPQLDRNISSCVADIENATKYLNHSLKDAQRASVDCDTGGNKTTCKADIAALTDDLTTAGTEISQAAEDCGGAGPACEADLEHLSSALVAEVNHLAKIAQDCSGDHPLFCVAGLLEAIAGILDILVAAGKASDDCFNQTRTDPDPLGPTEQYLKPFLDTIVDYRKDQVAEEYIFLYELVDVLPSWLSDLFIPLLIPGSTLTLPINKDIPLSVPIGPKKKIPLPAHIHLSNVTLNDLNEFKTLKPLFLEKNSRFTWGGKISLTDFSLTLRSMLVVLGHDVDVVMTMALAEPALSFDLIFAFERTKICAVFGNVMHSSVGCAMYPIFMRPQMNPPVSGVNITALNMSVTDFDFQLNVTGLGELNSVLAKELEEVVERAKPQIIAGLPTTISRAVMEEANKNILESIPQIQKSKPCHLTTLTPKLNTTTIYNASRVCFANNAGFDLAFAVHDCNAGMVSPYTTPFPIDQKRCQDVATAFPQAVPGDVFRLNTKAVFGLTEIAMPALRYVPNSNSAGFQCSGTTLDYHCEFDSLVPTNSSLPQVQRVCILNNAGFVMNFDVRDLRTNTWVGRTGNYPINEQKCKDLSAMQGVKHGDEFRANVHAILGDHNDVKRDVIYESNGLTATYMCQGTTLDYHCDLDSLK